MSPAPALFAAVAAACLVPAFGCITVGDQSATGRDLERIRADTTREADDFDKEHVNLSPDTHVAAGGFAESSGRTAEATQQYERALELDPHHAPALRRLGILQTKAGDWDAARGTWNRYVTATDGSAEAYAALGVMLERSGDPMGAEGALLKGIEADPRDKDCRVSYGLLLARQGRMEQGAEQLAEALPMAAVLYNLGAVHEQQNRPAEAEACYREALSIDPTMTQASQRLKKLGVATLE